MNESDNRNSEKVINSMLMLAGAAVENEDYPRAAKLYFGVLSLEPNASAQYNLGRLFALGLGVEQSYMKAAYHFHQAELLTGDEDAKSLCMQSLYDFIYQEIEQKQLHEVYGDLRYFFRFAMPEKETQDSEINEILTFFGGRSYKSENYSDAARLFRVAAQFGDDGYAANSLAILYNLGKGVEQNDLAALYWFDKAVDNGARDVALTDRDGLLNHYRSNLTPQDFYASMLALSGWCRVGSEDVPRDPAKAEYWREIAESIANN